MRVSTLLEVYISEWENAHKSDFRMRNYKNTRGKELFGKLDRIEAVINSMIDREDLTTKMVNERIREIVYEKEIEEEAIREEKEWEFAPDSEQKIMFNDFVDQYIMECETGLRKKKGGTKNISAGTIRSYRGFLSQLNEYQRARKLVIDFEDITMKFYNDFRLFLTDKRYSPNTIARMVKICKTICYAAEQLKLMDAGNIRAGFDVIYRDVDNVYLTDERIQELYDCDLSKHPAWEKVRDVFVVGCLTGQRVSDYKRVVSKMIVQLPDGYRYIKIKQEKTGNIVHIPLDDRVEEIMNRYGGELPAVQDQKMNSYIKLIGEYLGWTETVEIEEQRGAMEYTARKRFCDMLKTHTCRRSLATNMYRAGASLSSIMAITGHSSEQQLKTYLKLDSAEKSMIAAKEKYFARLKRV
jgi:site-specific recombinase XerD